MGKIKNFCSFSLKNKSIKKSASLAKKEEDFLRYKLKSFFRSYRGQNFLSRHVRILFERFSIRQILSPGLVFVIFSFILTPQALGYVETIQTINKPINNSLDIKITTEPTFCYPLKEFQITQSFSFFHWGIDLAAPYKTPVFPVAAGKIAEVHQSSWGFGNYLLVDHQNGQKSLYAHLAKINVKVGDEVSKETIIGLVGHTGWATGDHLHLEVYQNGLPLNPLEILSKK